ncbi:MAG: cell division protein FtsL [Candidatus Rokubacteria bacterium]|nr:cell division protein FtsL [Candidatus Rokubacteria bacterium]
MTNSQRLVREHDPRVRRSAAAALAGAALLVGAALGVAGLRVQQVHLTYRTEALRAERARADALNRQLDIEVATLRSPGRIETRARQLGLVPPGRDQIRLAREFTAAGTGLAADRSRTAALATPRAPLGQ